MGIKQTLTKDLLPLQYQCFNLQETKDGKTHSVYLLGDKYVVKIVSHEEHDALLNEQKLLDYLDSFTVPKLLDIVQKEEFILAFYTQIQGKSIAIPKKEHIQQIALFLKQFHSFSKDFISSNTKTYDTSYLKTLVLQTQNLQLSHYFQTINCNLKNDGVIHGDLFWDNAKFQNDTLSGVYDFISASQGDFIFDLAVVAVSWCFDGPILVENKLNVLVDTYGLKIEKEIFIEYIKYALLYYITTRYLAQREYQELLEKLEQL